MNAQPVKHQVVVAENPEYLALRVTRSVLPFFLLRPFKKPLNTSKQHPQKPQIRIFPVLTHIRFTDF